MITSKILIKGKDLKTYLEALKPEAGDDLGRASYSVSKGFTGLVVTIKAEDVNSFRAVMNSILNVMAIVDKTVNEVKSN